MSMSSTPPSSYPIASVAPSRLNAAALATAPYRGRSAGVRSAVLTHATPPSAALDINHLPSGLNATNDAVGGAGTCAGGSADASTPNAAIPTSALSSALPVAGCNANQPPARRIAERARVRASSPACWARARNESPLGEVDDDVAVVDAGEVDTGSVPASPPNNRRNASRT